MTLRFLDVRLWARSLGREVNAGAVLHGRSGWYNQLSEETELKMSERHMYRDKYRKSCLPSA